MNPRKRKKVLFAFGTRPEAIKLAPVIQAVLRRKDLFRCRIVATTQHRELLDDALSFFGIKPDYRLNIMTHGQTLTDISVRSLTRLESVLQAEKPDIVLVQGDTTSTLMAALSATYHRIPVAHVEAGLRSGDPTDPFPEETNRVLVDRLSALHFAPTRIARQNLLLEGFPAHTIFVTGNTSIDALHMARERALRRAPRLEPTVKDAIRRGCVLLTIHRRENRGPRLHNILLGIRDFAQRHPDRMVVSPAHPNPELRRAFGSVLGRTANVLLTEPLRYDAMIYLLERSLFVVTDSGGLQEEAPELGKKVLVVRRLSERPEGIDAGKAKLVGTNRNRIARAMTNTLRYVMSHRKNQTAHLYGDGAAADRIVRVLKSNLNFLTISATAAMASQKVN